MEKKKKKYRRHETFCTKKKKDIKEGKVARERLRR